MPQTERISLVRHERPHRRGLRRVDAVVHGGFYWLSAAAATIVGLIAMGLTTGAAIYVLRSLVGADQLPKKLAWLAQRKREST